MIFIIKILSAVSLIIFSNSAIADDLIPELRAVESREQRAPHIGFSAGVGSPEGSLDPRQNYALEFGFQAYIPIAIAGEFSVADYSDGNNDLLRTSILLKGTYNFGGATPLIRYSYVGAALGPVWEEENRSSGMAIGFQPMAGFDYPMKKYIDLPITLGANVSYLISSRGTPDVFATNGVIKYWY